MLLVMVTIHRFVLHHNNLKHAMYRGVDNFFEVGGQRYNVIVYTSTPKLFTPSLAGQTLSPSEGSGLRD